MQALLQLESQKVPRVQHVHKNLEINAALLQKKCILANLQIPSTKFPHNHIKHPFGPPCTENTLSIVKLTCHFQWVILLYHEPYCGF